MFRSNIIRAEHAIALWSVTIRTDAKFKLIGQMGTPHAMFLEAKAGQPCRCRADDPAGVPVNWCASVVVVWICGHQACHVLLYDV